MWKGRMVTNASLQVDWLARGDCYNACASKYYFIFDINIMVQHSCLYPALVKARDAAAL